MDKRELVSRYCGLAHKMLGANRSPKLLTSNLERNNMADTVAELKAKLHVAEAQQRESEEQERRKLVKEWKEITALRTNWEWSVATAFESVDWPDGQKIEGLRISCRVKPEVVGAWMLAHDGKPPTSGYSYSETEWHGMFYYRTDENILTHSGGGTHVLTTIPKLCSDEEWQDMVEGKIPNKFCSKWAGGSK